jgi:type II secretory ATPase GspE/PulE/Tfp pilus assembly ATPase PilB-like protein
MAGFRMTFGDKKPQEATKPVPQQTHFTRPMVQPPVDPIPAPNEPLQVQPLVVEAPMVEPVRTAGAPVESRNTQYVQPVPAYMQTPVVESQSPLHQTSHESHVVPQPEYQAEPVVHRSVHQQSSVASKKDMTEILTEMGVTPARIKFSRDRANMTGEHLSVIMRDFGFLPAEKVAEAIALNTGLEYFNEAKMAQIAGSSLLPLKSQMPEIFEGFCPVAFNGRDMVTVAVSDAAQISSAGNYFHEYQTRVVIASEGVIQQIYRKFFSSTEEAFDAYLRRYHEIVNSRTEDLDSTPGLLRDILGSLLRHACHSKVSDIHMHMTEYVGLIKLTIDGISTIFRSIPAELYTRMMQKLITDSRVKAEDLRAGMREATVEFSTEADMLMYNDVFSRFGFRLELGDAKGGFTAVIRILDRNASAAELKNLKFDAKTTSTLNRYIGTASGLILVTGPTGSGKTTTLYAMLKEIDPVTRSIQSVENPVEYRHGLWMQYEISRHAKNEGAEWSKWLKGLLRNAPKVILMGEVRDADTAKSLIEAANTGHLVFTTLHTNTASQAISRLRKLEVDMDSLAGELLGVLAQRLVRCLCKHCKTPDTTEETKEDLNLSQNPFLKGYPYQPHRASEFGCDKCNYSGYSGRRIVYELMDVTPTVRKLIEQNRSTSEIAMHGIKPGFSMWDCGLKLVCVGETSMEELRRVAHKEIFSAD